MELARCRKNPAYFIFNYCVTEDAQDADNPYKLFPRSPHLETVVAYWMNYNRLIIPKSRQMTISWCMCALYLWEALFFPSRNTFFSSQKEIDAEALCERTAFMYSKLPQFIKDFVQIDRKSCFLEFSNRSAIRGIAQGADHFRSYTLSGLFLDEGSTQQELPSMIKAAIPAIGQRGKITIVSSAAPSYFAELVFDRA